MDKADRNGRLLQMSYTAGVVNQQFVANLKSDGNYTLNIGGNHDMCVDARTPTAQSGVQSYQWSCNGKPWQRWNVRAAGNGYYEIYTAVNSGMALTRTGGRSPTAPQWSTRTVPASCGSCPSSASSASGPTRPAVTASKMGV